MQLTVRTNQLTFIHAGRLETCTAARPKYGKRGSRKFSRSYFEPTPMCAGVSCDQDWSKRSRGIARGGRDHRAATRDKSRFSSILGTVATTPSRLPALRQTWTYWRRSCHVPEIAPQRLRSTKERATPCHARDNVHRTNTPVPPFTRHLFHGESPSTRWITMLFTR